MAEIGTIIDGKYRILAEIGRGGMSIVYLAMDTHLNKQWAVKEIRKVGNEKKDEIIVNSLLLEADLMKRLDHPALPRIVDIIEDGITILVVMDYIEGESLDKILKRNGIQSEALVLEWAKQLCEALLYLHTRNPPIIYRDMKPGNIILKPEGNIKVIDFGIAREYKDLGNMDTTMLGTKGYAPPEQYSGRTDIRSDIYALGMTMYHLLTGVDPRSETAYRPVRMWNSDISESVEAIVHKCVQPIPENRYQNCQELLYDLQHPELISETYRRKQWKKLMAFWTAAILCLLFFTTGIICKCWSSYLKQQNYEILISPSLATALHDKIKSYQRAIEIYPERIEAYFCILEAYEDEGIFTTEDNDVFMSIYNKYKSKLDTSDSRYGELNYKIGMLYFNYFIDENNNISISTRVQKAYSFFEINHENEHLPEMYEHKNISECYYWICVFYKKYILSSVNVEEASKEAYEQLFERMRDTVEAMKDAGAYDKLCLYNAIFMFLYDQREELVFVNMNKEEVFALFDIVGEKTDDLIVNKQQSKNLKQEIQAHLDTYKYAIERAYFNAEGG